MYCSAKKSDIVSAIKKLYSAEFQAKLSKTVNPYGNGGASKEIIKIITKIDLKNIVKKKFHDIKQHLYANKCDIKQWYSFVKYTKIMDQNRGLSFANTFKTLYEAVKNYGYE